MNNKQEFEALFEFGCADLKLVEKNIGDGDIKEELLLFHLQQAIEKFLKALLSWHKIKFPKVHDIEKLIEVCEENNISLPEYVEEFIDLTPYAVEFRYGLMIDEVLDVNYYYQKVLRFKQFAEKIIHRL